MRTKYNPKSVEYLKTHFDNQFLIDDKDSSEELLKFVKDKKTYLEIGPGKGKFIVEMATKFSQFNFLAIELSPTICGYALKKIDESELSNVKLVYGDFYKLREILPIGIFEGIFLNFSDPRPKKRHEKRRLTSPLFLVEYAKILKLGGIVFFKSDNDSLYEYSLEKFNEYKWNILKNERNYQILDEFDAQTEYETKFKDKGIKIKRLILEKSCNTIDKVIEE